MVDNQPPNPGSTRPGRRRRIVWSLLSLAGSLVLCLAIVEIVLRLTGFSYGLRASIVQGAGAGDLRAAFDGCAIDRDLIWVPRRYAERLDGARATRPDILCLGDSCTELASYDARFAELARAAFPDRGITVAQLGVTGWSTYQGLRQLRRDVIRIKPRVVTIYYGWNDHWKSIGLTDRELAELNASPLFRLQSLRLGQLITRAYVGLRRRGPAEPPLRVPPDEFRGNLIAIVAEARAQGIIPVLLTAPTSHAPGAEPASLAPRWITNLGDLVPLHEQYIEMVRAVARAHRVPLCDLAARFDTPPAAAGRSDLFQADGIHLTPEGDRLVARCLFDCFERDGLFDGLGQPLDANAEGDAPP
jgi:lysophospholipase L1-like esterase